MYCPYCGKENTAFDLHCSGCGKSLQNNKQNQNSIEAEQTPDKPKKKKGFLLGIIAVVVVAFIVIMNLGTDNSEYTDNSGDELPVVVNRISYKKNIMPSLMDITLEFENLT